MRTGHVLRSDLAGDPECRLPHLFVQRSAAVYLLKRMYQLSLLRDPGCGTAARRRAVIAALPFPGCRQP